jgi:hypothetical protein
MMHLIRRWDLDHTGEMHMSWMNGAGMLLWENIFGSWNGWNDRDLSILRSMLPIQRHFAGLFNAGEWTPLVPCTLKGSYASRWSKDSATVWTLVNRSGEPVSGNALPESSQHGARMFDLIRGVEIDHAAIEIPPRGVGAIAALPNLEIASEFAKLLEGQAKRWKDRVSEPRRIDPMPVRIAFERTRSTALHGMVKVSGGLRTIVSSRRVRECGDYVYFQQEIFPDLHQTRHLRRIVDLRPFALDMSDVTNRQYDDFREATGRAHETTGRVTVNENDPVVGINLDEARAYAKWAGKRLPTEDEWQVAFEEHGLQPGGLWNWTESEYSDGHTTFSILKGGWSHVIEGSEWYADSGLRGSDWSAKFIHFNPFIDRCESIGIRCAVDL